MNILKKENNNSSTNLTIISNSSTRIGGDNYDLYFFSFFTVSHIFSFCSYFQEQIYFPIVIEEKLIFLVIHSRLLAEVPVTKRLTRGIQQKFI